MNLEKLEQLFRYSHRMISDDIGDLMKTHHVEQTERVEEASLRVFKLLLLNGLLLLRLPPPHLKIRFEKVFFSSNSHLLLPLHPSTSSATPRSPDQPPHPSPHPLPARALLSVANRQKEGALEEEAQQVHLNKRFLHNG